jgi:dienelactone hydrolase
MIKSILLLCCFSLSLLGKDTLVPISDSAKLPKSAIEFWEDYDPHAEPLEVKMIKEWKTDEVTTRYLTYKVGRFKGADSRVAAYYSFPNKPGKHPAFVWTHGGGQRAEKNRSVYFAKQGFANIDINWLGRPVKEDIDTNTDWGKVDPTQGPRFYSKALRKGWKVNLQPDEFSIDPIPSPRNSNWILLSMAGRRAITFLEKQAEVHVDKIGFTGFSMGGMITALTATDPRLKAVAPFVGGTAFKYVDFPGGIVGSSKRPQFQNLEMYKKVIDPVASWPYVKCPVAFITSSNDFHSTFERIYRSMDLLPHGDWRVSSNVHYNHGVGPEEWALLNLWFKKYLGNEQIVIPETPPSIFSIDKGMATFSVSPKVIDRLAGVKIYYSYDPNSRTRFWHNAVAKKSKNTWTTDIPVYPQLPLYVFGHCRYKLDQEMTLQVGSSKTFSINSKEAIHEPKNIDLKELSKLAKNGLIEDFSKGTADWASRNGDSITTYKLQSPMINRSNHKVLAFTIDPQGRDHTLRLRLGSSFLSRENNIGTFTYNTKVTGKGPQQVLIKRKDFKSEKDVELEWAKIATLNITLVDLKQRKAVRLTDPKTHSILKRIELIDPRKG